MEFDPPGATRYGVDSIFDEMSELSRVPLA
jgi:hypothetical protein